MFDNKYVAVIPFQKRVRYEGLITWGKRSPKSQTPKTQLDYGKAIPLDVDCNHPIWLTTNNLDPFQYLKQDMVITCEVDLVWKPRYLSWQLQGKKIRVKK